MFDDLPQNISSFGGDVDSIIRYIWWIILVWFVAAEGFLVYTLVRYRRREGRRAGWLPADTLKANAWVLAPVVLVLALDLSIEAKSHGVWHEVKGQVPQHDVLVRVTARQFAWTFTYAGPDGALDTEDDFQTGGFLYVPANKVVRFQLESTDVLHSFWIPVLRLKQDAVPGRSIRGWFKATEPGTYEIACAEICGGGHTSMRARLVVLSEDDYARWAETMAQQRHLIVEATGR